MEQQNMSYELDLMQILRALWQRVWIIILASVLGLGLAFSYTTFLLLRNILLE